MKYLIDTDYVVDYLKGKTQAIQLLTTLAPNGLAISLITYGEIYEGIYYGHNPSYHERVFLNFLRGVSVLPLNKPTLRQFAHIRGRLRAQGKLIGDPDLLIGATTIYYQLSLLTHNIRHFNRIPKLKLYQAI